MIKVTTADHQLSANAQANVQRDKAGSGDSSSKRPSGENTPDNQLLGTPRSKQKQNRKRSAQARIKKQKTNMDHALQSKLEIRANDSEIMSNQIDDMINNQMMKQKPEENDNYEWGRSSESESESASDQDGKDSISDSGVSDEEEDAEEDMSSGDQSQ